MMNLLAEIHARIKRGYLAHFTNELYKWNCEIRTLDVLDADEQRDLFRMEIVYGDTGKFNGFLEKIGRHLDNFRVEDVRNALEQEIQGGLIRITGKVSIDSAMDYEMRLLGASELIMSRIEHESGARDFTAMSRNVAMAYGYLGRDDPGSRRLLGAFTAAERDSVVLSHFGGFNPFPLIVRFEQIEDFIKTLQRTSETFSAVRILGIEEEHDPERYELVYGSLNIPVVSRPFDEIPLLVLTVLTGLMKRHKHSYEDMSVGIIGIDAGIQRLTRMLRLLGCSRVLGYDDNEMLMMGFENRGGLSTTQENIFNNSDVIILAKNHFSDEDLIRVMPGQIIISLIEDELVNMELVQSRGVREFFSEKNLNCLTVSPGLVRGLIACNMTLLVDGFLIRLAQDLSVLAGKQLLPALYSDVHERIPVYLREYAGNA
jgi:hypothetical protein